MAELPAQAFSAVEDPANGGNESAKHEKDIKASESSLSEPTPHLQEGQESVRPGGVLNNEVKHLPGISIDDAREKDIEKGDFPHTKSDEIKPSDLDIVDWDGPDDVANPVNWSKRKKWGIIATLSTMTFIT